MIIPFIIFNQLETNMQYSSKYEPGRTREEQQANSNTSGFRQTQGYITLSPSRKIKDRNKS